MEIPAGNSSDISTTANDERPLGVCITSVVSDALRPMISARVRGVFISFMLLTDHATYTLRSNKLLKYKDTISLPV